MGFSKFLDSRRERAKALVGILKEHFQYVTVLGVDNKSKAIRVNSATSNIGPGMDTECGFVVKVNDGGCFFEYSLDDIGEDIPALAKKTKRNPGTDATGRAWPVTGEEIEAILRIADR